ncbi:hypothetical protein [Virgibacillus alimentarius]|uniref:Peptidyl-prolyl cis-trans isomerase n=1 Tax=Virgibacillus alimentarius TaxID=698769 RepID=A0ABS4S3K9_9BACI|nr:MULTISPECIES: hypothetical protein [Virgibacillus]MBP2256075.1 hypothetical protein [Virgibacillus alimentarius]HLR66022.1 hypothetical protein [Virgibacillus sp.]
MIIQLTGNVTYPITLDPTVWIFDDRKILLEDAFSKNKTDIESVEADELEKAAERWSREIYQQKIKPPINKSISRLEGKKILTNSYVMPINDFINHAEVKPDAKNATLVTKNEEVNISLDELRNCYLMFAYNGKPLKEDGPVYFYYGDGSNKDAPIKEVQKIIVN